MALTAQAEEQQGLKRTSILVIVILIHVAGYVALQSGLARRLVEILPKDIKTEIIKEETKEEPPPPPPPPPPDQVPPPPFIPPVEVALAPLAEPPPTTIVGNSEKPPTVTAPVMQPRQPTVVGPRVDMKKSLGSCDELYTSSLQRENAAGTVVVRCTIGTNGRCNDPAVANSSGNEAIDGLGKRCAKELLRFTPGTVDGVVQAQTYDFKLTFRAKER